MRNPAERRLLPRRRVLERLHDGLDRKLVLIRGAAGSGKSTLLARMAELADRPMACVVLDAHAQDPPVLLRAIRDALDLSVPDVQLELAPPAEAIRSLLPTLADRAPFVLGLDDAHELGDSRPALDVLSALVRGLPSGATLVLASRGPVRIPLAELRMAGGLSEIADSDLDLSEAEVRDLVAMLAPRASLTPELVQRLHEATHGWLAAVILFASGPIEEDPEGALDGLASAGGAVAEYLAEHLLDGLDPPTVRHLECAAALEPFTHELLEKTLGEDCAEFMHQAERQHLIVPSNEGVFGFTGLFGEVVRARLRSRPEEWREVHRRAAAIHLARDDLERALHHLLEANETEDAVKLLVTVGFAAMSVNRTRSLGRYLDRVAPEQIEAHASLRFARGTVRMMRLEIQSGIADFEAVARNQGDPGLAAAAGARLANMRIWQGRFRDAARDARHAIALAPPLPDPVSVYAHALLESALRHLGKDEEAEPLGAALDAAEIPYPASMIAPFNRALCARLRGEFAEEGATARHWIERIRRSSPQLGIGAFYMLAAGSAARLGNAGEAIRLADEGIAITDSNGEFWWGGACRMTRVEAYADLGQRDLARSEGEALVQSCRGFGQPWIEAETLLLLAGIAPDPSPILDEAWEATSRTQNPSLRAAVATARAGVSLDHGNLAEAENRIVEAEKELGNVRARDRRRAIALLRARIALLVGDRARATELVEANLVEGPALRTVRRHLVPILFQLWRAGNADARAQILATGVQALPHLLRMRSEDARVLVEAILDQNAGPLKVQTLGPFRVLKSRGGCEVAGEVAFRSPRVAELLRVLLLHSDGGFVPKEVLIEELWPCSKVDVENSFHTHLSYLRRALEPHLPSRIPSRYLLREGGGYRLDLRGGRWDAADFEAEAKAGLAALRRGEIERGRALVGMALARYRGPLLEDHPYLEAASARRQRLAGLMIEASLALAESARARGEHFEATELLERLLAQDPTVEDAYRLLMEVAADRDRHDHIAPILERCRSALLEHCDAAPSPETESLATRLSRP